MYRPLPTVTDDQKTLRRQLQQARDAEQTRRLHLLALIAEGRVRTRPSAADALAVHRNTVSRWLARYEQGGVEALLRVNAGGAPGGQRTLSPAAFTALQARLHDPNGFESYREVQQGLAAHWGEAIPYAQVHRLVHRRLKATLKRPRPQHPPKTPPRRRCSPSVSSEL